MATIHYEYDNKLEKLLIQNGMDRKVHDIVKNVLKKARARLTEDARTALPKDPRQAYKAVRFSVYKQILGGNLSILQRRGGNVQMRFYEPPRKLKQGQRGGNRMARSRRTTDLMSYYGTDRGFILRFLNSGTQDRTDNTRGGNRGRITPRNWFPGASEKQMKGAMEELSKLIEEEIQNTLA